MRVFLIVPIDDPIAENASMSLGSIEAYKSEEKAKSMMKMMKSPDDKTERIVKPFLLIESPGDDKKVQIDKNGQVGLL